MNLQIKLFATLKDKAGAHVAVDLPDDATVATLLDRLAQAYPKLASSLPTCLVAVNQEFAFGATPIRSGDEVALFPPVSGGSSYPEFFHITDRQIDLNDLVASITLPATGGICTFTGTVRGVSEDHATQQLFYEAYAPMAEAKMKQVADEIRARWPLVQGIAMVQRIGQLNVGEFTVMIAISAAHRDQGIFDAARYGIDRLKEIVPVWKKEIGPQGEQWVEGHYHPTSQDVIGDE
jgi:molybdopterin synthase catalytic subunit